MTPTVLYLLAQERITGARSRAAIDQLVREGRATAGSGEPHPTPARGRAGTARRVAGLLRRRPLIAARVPPSPNPR